VDSDQIRQVLWNLLNNAAQAMPEGGTARIELDAKIKDRRGENPERAYRGEAGEVEGAMDAEEAGEVAGRAGGTGRAKSAYDGIAIIRVIDEGVGIPEEEIEQMFDPFFTTKEKGIGLGLPIVHRIIEEHGGNISVVSEPEIGSTFSVELPLRASVMTPMDELTKGSSSETRRGEPASSTDNDVEVTTAATESTSSRASVSRDVPAASPAAASTSNAVISNP